MTTFFYNPCNNFGDIINNIFFDLLTERKNNYIKDTNTKHILATGSILTKTTKHSIIYGSGFISEDSDLGGNKWKNFTNKKYISPYKILLVRGPKTREKFLKFNIDCPESYGDPLMLFPILYNNDNINIKYKIGIIPHYIDKNNENYKKLYNNLGKKHSVLFIDIQTNDYKKFVDSILSCEYIISSSLHGVIMGIAYKRKTVFVQFSKNVTGGDFKFQDFFESLDINYKNKNIYDCDVLNNIICVDYTKYKKICENIISSGYFIKNKNILIKNIYKL